MSIIDNQICSPSITLSEATDKFLTIRGVDKKKFYAKYLVVAAKIWEDIFQKTIWCTQSTWKPLMDGKPYPYVELPKGMARLFSLAVEDDCGNIQPLYLNQQRNVISAPTSPECKCGCDSCAGLCEDLGNTTMTTKVAFVQFGVTYYEKTWVKLCPNGDILEYREIPTKKYNDRVGETGDYNQDYNNDYDIGSEAFSNFEVVTEIQQRKICALDVKPCGCPKDTEENRCKIIDNCGSFLRNDACCYKKHCNEFLPAINDNHRGQVKISDCGTKAYYLKPIGVKYPKHLLVNYQTDGRLVNAETTLPTYAEMCLWAGIDYLIKKFNNVYNRNDRQEAFYAYNHEQNELIKFLNPLSLSDIAKVQNQENKW